jgi:hypothetical protein
VSAGPHGKNRFVFCPYCPLGGSPRPTGGDAVLDVAIVVTPRTGGPEVVFVVPFSPHRDWQYVIDLLCDLGAPFAFDLASVVVALQDFAAYASPWSGVLGFPSHWRADKRGRSTG